MRKLKKDWISEYLTYVSYASQSPESFHFWSAATVLAATLKRNVWVDRGTFKIYPNLYTVLVGRPATGKGNAIDPALDVLKEANTANVLSDRLTIEYVLEKLSKGFPITSVTANTISIGVDASAVVFAPELSVFLRDSSDALSDLTQLWDNRDSFDYGTRHKGLYTITKPCLSLLGGSPPAWLAKSIPADAIGGGFTSRVNFIYTKSDPKLPLWAFSKNGTPRAGKDDLVNDLRHMSQLRGPFTATPAFATAFDSYTQGIKFDDFEEESTTAFKARKWANATKLAMILCVARTDSLELDVQDWLKAAAMVDDVEKDLQLVFRSVGESADASGLAKLLEFIEKRPTGATMPDIMRCMWRHFSKDDAARMIMTLTESGMVRETTSGHRSIYLYNGPARFIQP